jgi:hypothetical protein
MSPAATSDARRQPRQPTSPPARSPCQARGHGPGRPRLGARHAENGSKDPEKARPLRLTFSLIQTAPGGSVTRGSAYEERGTGSEGFVIAHLVCAVCGCRGRGVSGAVRSERRRSHCVASSTGLSDDSVRDRRGRDRRYRSRRCGNVQRDDRLSVEGDHRRKRVRRSIDDHQRRWRWRCGHDECQRR